MLRRDTSRNLSRAFKYKEEIFVDAVAKEIAEKRIKPKEGANLIVHRYMNPDLCFSLISRALQDF